MYGFLINVEGNFYLLSEKNDIIGGSTFTTKDMQLSKIIV